MLVGFVPGVFVIVHLPNGNQTLRNYVLSTDTGEVCVCRIYKIIFIVFTLPMLNRK